MNELSHQLLQSAAGKQWNHIGISTHHGIALPLFSLHSQNSCGVGEYLDLIPLIPWVKKIGFDIIQLLPLNDTGPDVSPYNAISAFALNPIFITLSKLPFVESDEELKAILVPLQKLNETQRIEYAKVKELKEAFTHRYFEAYFTKFSSDPVFNEFVAVNAWLKGYALFKILKEERAWHSWTEWEEPLKNVDSVHINELYKKYADKINYHILIQYLCYTQLKHVKEVADQNKVFIKGDIPILISRESADVWLHQRLFFLEFSAGAPPDMLGPKGQNWGFPLYNWEAIELEDYSWWKKRLTVASEYYHLYRLDHIVGFFRIWAIPLGNESKDGYFIPTDISAWIPQGTKIMKMMLESCSMLPIGEDLGTVPDEVRTSMRDVGISGTKVLRWERKWHDPGQPFIPFNAYNPLGMTTVSTHDSETLALWWKNNPDEVKEFCRFKQWEYQDHLTLERQQEILRDSHHTASLFHINLIQEYLSLVPNMTWVNLEDERINVPGIISEKNWTYRFRPSVEEIVSSQPLAQVFENAVK